MVNWRNHHFEQLVPRDWVLSPREVGLAKEDADGFYVGRSGALEACYVGYVGYVEIHVVITYTR